MFRQPFQQDKRVLLHPLQSMLNIYSNLFQLLTHANVFNTLIWAISVKNRIIFYRVNDLRHDSVKFTPIHSAKEKYNIR